MKTEGDGGKIQFKIKKKNSQNAVSYNTNVFPSIYLFIIIF